MCLQRLGRVRNDARLLHLVGNGNSTFRLAVSSHQFQKFVQTVFHALDLGTELVWKLRNRCFQLSSRLSVLLSV